ncbi:MAG: DUF4268 domain-containing protein [Lachnospiraceae bacterium]|nr:DUF4268 domain-containing protein [Lachnospiraceae bacterium]
MTVKYKIVPVTKISARDLWPEEERDFTPWLKSNIKELSDVLGMDLEVIDSEVRATTFELDLFAEDRNVVSEQNKVVIENQYGKSDHKHLGQLITYASVLGANAAIWIAEDFDEGHLKAIEWLNENSLDNIGFYAVRVEVWKLSEDTVCVKFVVVAQPDNLVREGVGRERKLTPTNAAQFRFWEKFKDKLADELAKHGEIWSLRSARAQNWYDIGLGRTGIFIRNSVSFRDGFAKASIFISEERVEEMLPILKANKDTIHEKLGFDLDWPSEDDTNLSKIVSIKNDKVNFDDENSYDEAINWLAEMTIKLKEVFAEYI